MSGPFCQYLQSQPITYSLQIILGILQSSKIAKNVQKKMWMVNDEAKNLREQSPIFVSMQTLSRLLEKIIDFNNFSSTL